MFFESKRIAQDKTMESSETPAKPRHRLCRYFLLGILLVPVYLIGCRADMLARQFLFYPPKYPTGDWDRTGGGFQEISFKNTRNETLNGRYFAFDPSSSGEVARGSVLYCHGNGENISYLTPLAVQLRDDLHCNILLFDYAGYGKSEGTPTAPGILEDGRAARDWLATHDGIAKNQVIVSGFSLGGSVATDIAANDGARALIVESSFTSVGDMGRRMVPFLPVNWMLKERLPSVEKISRFTGPVFISHGEGDQVIPYTQGQRLFEAANEPKTFYTPPAGLDYHSAPHGTEHREKLREFVDSLQ